MHPNNIMLLHTRAPIIEHHLKSPLKLTVCVCVHTHDLGLLIWSWHYGVKLVFFFPLLCLASCSHHLAPGFEKQAKSLPPGWHENIPASTQPSCRSLLSQPPNAKAESGAVEYRGLCGSTSESFDDKKYLKVKVNLDSITFK